ncbi:ABC transporter ATP-binding protein [Helicobacter cetorum]|uniref:Multidrug resistance protein (HetA) n=1 Tax=Helicobacter cetorum (strain ATCC BAA-429 / MIT 00-7128) TaxID=182217 RepID=I0EPV4_HELC0|nr:ABC transporter ATP-binding protein [Helicobacter cetorum]AFI04973.1 multidrug resistance protein (hetA) [Helicobacter cetorum MIT 00-7128]
MATKKNNILKYFLRSIKQISMLITKRDKNIFLVLTIMSIAFSIIEVFSISMIMPFITLASNPNLIIENHYSKIIYDFFHFASPIHFMYFFSFALVGLYFFRMFFGVCFTYLKSRFAYKKTHAFKQQLFLHHIKAHYQEHLNYNIEYLRDVIYGKVYSLITSFNAFLGILTELSIVSFLYVMLLITNWKMTLVLTLILATQILLITKNIATLIQKKGQIVSISKENTLKIFSKFFNNFKMTKLKDNHEKAHHLFEENNLKAHENEIIYTTLQVIPRYILETIGFSLLISAVAYILFKYGEAQMVLPIISMYALALYRMLPSVTKILGYYNEITYCQRAVNIVFKNLSKPTTNEDSMPINFYEKIVLKNISFSYKAKNPILQDFNLTICKGQKVAFVGPSGCGKSTLVDIIMGIIYPKSGEVFIDDTLLTPKNIRSWRKKIGYIPQNIYLFNGTIAENIVCGSALDEERVIEVCKMAHIYDFLCEHEGINTQVGEGGAKLSGGQKQRIGIARALYDNPEILVLDEATSALDTETESKIMDEIYQIAKDKTLLVIAHRLSTIERCEIKIDMSKQ